MNKIVKGFALIVCIATFGMLSSCTKDYAELIVGKWKQVSYTDNVQTAEIPDQDAEIWEFTASGEVIATFQGEVRTSTTYVVDGDMLIVDSETAIIKKLDKTTLSLEKKETDTRSVIVECRRL